MAKAFERVPSLSPQSPVARLREAVEIRLHPTIHVSTLPLLPQHTARLLLQGGADLFVEGSLVDIRVSGRALVARILQVQPAEQALLVRLQPFNSFIWPGAPSVPHTAAPLHGASLCCSTHNLWVLLFGWNSPSWLRRRVFVVAPPATCTASLTATRTDN